MLFLIAVQCQIVVNSIYFDIYLTALDGHSSWFHACTFSFSIQTQEFSHHSELLIRNFILLICFIVQLPPLAHTVPHLISPFPGRLIRALKTPVDTVDRQLVRFFIAQVTTTVTSPMTGEFVLDEVDMV